MILETIKLDLNISANFGTTSRERFLLLMIFLGLVSSLSFTYSLNSSGFNELPNKDVIALPYKDSQSILYKDLSHWTWVASSFLHHTHLIKTATDLQFEAQQYAEGLSLLHPLLLWPTPQRFQQEEKQPLTFRFPSRMSAMKSTDQNL